MPLFTTTKLSIVLKNLGEYLERSSSDSNNKTDIVRTHNKLGVLEAAYYMKPFKLAKLTTSKKLIVRHFHVSVLPKHPLKAIDKD